MAEQKKPADKTAATKTDTPTVDAKPNEVPQPDEAPVVQGNSVVGQEPGEESFAYTPPKD